MLCSFLPGTGTGNMIPGSLNTATSATKESSSRKGWDSWKTWTFSALNIAKETLFIVVTLCQDGTCGENGSLTSVTGWQWLTPACVRVLSCALCSVLVTGVKRAQVLLTFFHYSKSCSMEQATWFLVSTECPEAVTQQQQQNSLPKTRSEVSAMLKLVQLSTLRRKHPSLIWLFDENEHCEKTGSLTVITGWHLHVYPFFSTGDRYELDCCMTATSTGKTGKTLN